MYYYIIGFFGTFALLIGADHYLSENKKKEEIKEL